MEEQKKKRKQKLIFCKKTYVKNGFFEKKNTSKTISWKN